MIVKVRLTGLPEDIPVMLQLMRERFKVLDVGMISPIVDTAYVRVFLEVQCDE